MPMLHYLWSFKYLASMIMCGRNWLCYFLTQEFISQEFQGKQQRLQEWRKILDFFSSSLILKVMLLFQGQNTGQLKLSLLLEGKPCSRSMWGVGCGHRESIPRTRLGPGPLLPLSSSLNECEAVAALSDPFSSFPFILCLLMIKRKRLLRSCHASACGGDPESTRRWRQAALNTLGLLFCSCTSCSPCPRCLLPHLKTGIDNYIVTFR